MADQVRILCTMLVACLMLGIPAWAGIVPAGALQFTDNGVGTQGLLSFTPGVGTGVLTIGVGNGGLGGLMTDLLNGVGLCAGDCAIVGGYLTLTSGLETSGVVQGTGVLYTFGALGSLSIYGGLPALGIPLGSLLLTAPFLAGDTFNVVPSGLTATGTFQGPLDYSNILVNPALGAYTFTSGSNMETSMDLNLSCATLNNACSGSVDPTVQVQTPVPEPGTLSLLGAGLFTFGVRLRSRGISRLRD
jgi:PEP-CTERM motif